MNRRSVLRWLGLAPVAAPAAVAAASAPALAPIPYPALDQAVRHRIGSASAGYYIDLLPDGTSRFVVDASQFEITSNGDAAHPFTFDGETLRVPSLVVPRAGG